MEVASGEELALYSIATLVCSLILSCDARVMTGLARTTPHSAWQHNDDCGLLNLRIRTFY
jgi:hypothetical protein